MNTPAATARHRQKAPSRRANGAVAPMDVRFTAWVLDLMVFFIIFSVFFVIAGLLLLLDTNYGEVDPSNAGLWTFIGVWAASVPIALLYVLMFWTWRGQTVGKMAMGIRVVQESGRPLGFLGALRRLLAYFAYAALFLAPITAAAYTGVSLEAIAAAAGLGLLLILVGHAIALFTDQHRALHDLIGGTIVVEE